MGNMDLCLTLFRPTLGRHESIAAVRCTLYTTLLAGNEMLPEILQTQQQRRTLPIGEVERLDL